MPIPVTPAEILAAVPQTTQNVCQALANALLRFPRLIYNFFAWAIKPDGSGVTNDFLNEFWDVGDYKMSVDNGLDTGVATSPWLLCDGRTVSQVDYAELYSLLGTTFGPAAAGTFTLPDFQDKFILTVSGAHVLAATGGSATHNLATNEMPAHTHDVTITAGDHVNPGPYISSSDEVAVQGTVETSSVGGGPSAGLGAAHNNMPPYLVAGYMYIKT